MCFCVYIYYATPYGPCTPPADDAHMSAQCICNALVSAYIVQAFTMHKESATKTVTYLQLETVMQSVAMLTADYRVVITEKGVRHQVDAQSTTPIV